VDKLFSSMEMENTSIPNYLVLCSLKVVKIIIYNIDVIKSGY